MAYTWRAARGRLWRGEERGRGAGGEGALHLHEVVERVHGAELPDLLLVVDPHEVLRLLLAVHGLRHQSARHRGARRGLERAALRRATRQAGCGGPRQRTAQAQGGGSPWRGSQCPLRRRRRRTPLSARTGWHAPRAAAGSGARAFRPLEACVRACAPEGSLGSSHTKRARGRAGRGRTASSVYAAIPWTGMPGRRSGRRAPSAGPAASPALLGSCGRLGDLKAMPRLCAHGIQVA